jgi:formamidopyrimidine-DNA glycosylase
MPELPEVERGRRLAASVAEGRRIVRAGCAPDVIVFEGQSPRRLRRALVGARVERVDRRGKVVLFLLDRPPHALFRFGMTGAFRTQDTPPIRLRAHGRRVDDAWPPRFAKLSLDFEDGGRLVFTNARRLGRVLLRRDPLGEPPLSKLGFDPLTSLPPLATFRERVWRRKVTLKGLLLDQSFAAGVGNWIADEVLYQARLDPRRRADSLADDEVRRLRSRLAHVVKKAVAVDAEKDRFPRTWLFHHRWGRRKDARTARGERVEFLTVAGRTTAWVPSAQAPPSRRTG